MPLHFKGGFNSDVKEAESQTLSLSKKDGASLYNPDCSLSFSLVRRPTGDVLFSAPAVPGASGFLDQISIFGIPSNLTEPDSRSRFFSSSSALELYINDSVSIHA